MRSGILRLLFAGYLTVVAFGVFGPSPGEELEQAADRVRKVEREVRSVAPGGSADEAPPGPPAPDEWIFGDLSAEDVGNIAMFLPFGVIFPLLWPRWWWLTVPAGVALSGCIELVQLLFLPWRSPSLADLGWNSLGAVTGFGLWWAGPWWWRRRRGRDGSPGGNPSELAQEPVRPRR